MVDMLGMQVQLHPLLRRGVLPALMLDAVMMLYGLELHVLAVPRLSSSLPPAPAATCRR